MLLVGGTLTPSQRTVAVVAGGVGVLPPRRPGPLTRMPFRPPFFQASAFLCRSEGYRRRSARSE